MQSLKQILDDEGQYLKRLVLILLLLALGAIATMYLAKRLLPGRISSSHHATSLDFTKKTTIARTAWSEPRQLR